MSEKTENELKALELSQKVRALCDEQNAVYAFVTAIKGEYSDELKGFPFELSIVTHALYEEDSEVLFAGLNSIVKNLSDRKAFIMTPFAPAAKEQNRLHGIIEDQQDDAVTLNAKIDDLAAKHEAQAKHIERMRQLELELREELRKSQSKEQELRDSMHQLDLELIELRKKPQD